MPGQSAMPAAGRSTAAIHVLTARLEDVPPGADVGPLPGLAQFLAAVPDHRRAQGRRHSLVSVLSLARAAVAAGARSLVAIAEWAADAQRPPPTPPRTTMRCRQPRSAQVRWMANRCVAPSSPTGGPCTCSRP